MLSRTRIPNVHSSKAIILPAHKPLGNINIFTSMNFTFGRLHHIPTSPKHFICGKSSTLGLHLQLYFSYIRISADMSSNEGAGKAGASRSDQTWPERSFERPQTVCKQQISKCVLLQVAFTARSLRYKGTVLSVKRRRNAALVLAS